MLRVDQESRGIEVRLLSGRHSARGWMWERNRPFSYRDHGSAREVIPARWVSSRDTGCLVLVK